MITYPIYDGHPLNESNPLLNIHHLEKLHHYFHSSTKNIEIPRNLLATNKSCLDQDNLNQPIPQTLAAVFFNAGTKCVNPRLTLPSLPRS
jgi:hypothetical protein